MRKIPFLQVFLELEHAGGKCDLVTVHESAYSAAEGAHAIVLCTEWDQFREIDYERVYSKMEKPGKIISWGCFGRKMFVFLLFVGVFALVYVSVMSFQARAFLPPRFFFKKKTKFVAFPIC